MIETRVINRIVLLQGNVGNGVRAEVVQADSSGQGQLPSGPRRRVQKVFSQVYDVPQPERERQLSLQGTIQRLPRVPHGKRADGQGGMGRAWILRLGDKEVLAFLVLFFYLRHAL